MRWPEKHSVLGISVSAVGYVEAVESVIAAAVQGRPALVTALAVHGVVEASRDPALRSIVNEFDMVTPDGHPVKSALNMLHGTALASRVCGPDLMLRLCARAAEKGVSIYLYGSRPAVVNRLADNLSESYPGLRIAGAEPSVFRPLSETESGELGSRISESGAGVVFIGLGCPRQEKFAYAHRRWIPAVQVCVGAAFDFHAGMLRRAPQWMQDHSLEWFYRLLQEPGRLWRRYAWTNSAFMAKLAWQWVSQVRGGVAEISAAGEEGT